MSVLLDTSVLVAAERELDRSAQLLPAADDWGVSAVTVLEYWHGVERADSATRRRQRTEFFERTLAGAKIVAFDEKIGRTGARIWAQLDRSGERIPALDLIIAATALTFEWALATWDRRHFGRVDGLEVIELT